MTKVQTTYPKSANLTLKQMENRINNDEAWALRLELLGKTDTESLCTFVRSTSVPAKKIRLQLAADPPGSGTLVHKGNIWIEGNATDVAAYR